MQIDELIRNLVAEEVKKAKTEILAEFKVNSPILDIQETSDMLCISKESLYRLCKTQSIPHIRFGADGSRKPAIKFRLHDLQAWLNEQSQKNYKKVN